MALTQEQIDELYRTHGSKKRREEVGTAPTPEPKSGISPSLPDAYTETPEENEIQSSQLDGAWDDFLLKNTDKPAADSDSVDINSLRRGINKAEEMEAGQEKGFFARVWDDFKERGEDIGETFGQYKSGEITGFESGLQTLGQIAGGITDVVGQGLVSGYKALPEGIKEGLSDTGKALLDTEVGEQALGALQQGIETYEDWAKENPRFAENLEATVNIADLVGLGAIAKSGVKGVGKAVGEDLGRVAKEFGEQVSKDVKGGVKRVFDRNKPVKERISNVKKAIGERAEMPIEKKAVKESKVLSFVDNPAISGALDDIKIMVGLPESTPSVDLAFRAVKPRITKGKNLRRVKAQMALANETIAGKGLKPKGIREYADAIFETKKDVWSQIQSKLDAGQLADKEVDLIPIALRILDRAEDTALQATSPQAAIQLTRIAEDLVSQGDTVDILTAERIKQFLNAELDDAFGATDLSKQAKEAKKMITRDIGTQLDEALSDLPDEFRELKVKYGALSSIEDDVLKRVIVFERRNPEGLTDILTKTEAAADIAFGGTTGRLRGIARLTIGSQLKKANDADELIKRAFEKLKVNKPPKTKAVTDTAAPKAVNPQGTDQFFGAVAGLEIDEEGNVTFDPGKALLGMMGTVAIKKIKKPTTSNLKNFTINTPKNIKTFRGEGGGIGNMTYVAGKYMADSPEFAKAFGEVTEHSIPKGSKLFDFDVLKTQGNDIIPEKIINDPYAVTAFLKKLGYNGSKNTNARGVEYVLFDEPEGLLKKALEFDDKSTFKRYVLDNWDEYRDEINKLSSKSNRSQIQAEFGELPQDKIWKLAQNIKEGEERINK